MVHGAGARRCRARRGRRVVGVEPAALARRATSQVVVAARLEAERALEQRAAALGVGREGADAVEALERELGGDLGVLGDERRVRRSRRPRARARGPPGRRSETRPARRVDAIALAGEPLLPEVERLVGADAADDRVHHPGARPAAPRARVLEEGDVGARAALLVGVEEVVDGRVVLVDRLLDQPQAEHARVEVDVPRRVARDQRDVVDALERMSVVTSPAARTRHVSKRTGSVASAAASRSYELTAVKIGIVVPFSWSFWGAVVEHAELQAAALRGAWARRPPGHGQRPARSVHPGAAPACRPARQAAA